MTESGRRVLTVGAVLLAVSLVTTATAAGQQTDYRAPRTPDGQPDLQGFWTNQTYTRLQRPDGVTKEFYTPEEVAALESGAAQRETSQTEPGTIPDVHYDFTQFGLDRSQSAFASSLRTSLIVDPSDGRLPPVTPEGQRRAAARAADQERLGGRWDSAESNQLDDRCVIMRGAGPPMLNAGYNANYHIVQAPGYVMILVEMIHDARVIPVDGRGQPPSAVRQWMGASTGRWEGETLVVETANFNGKNPIQGSSDQMRVTERFTRVADDAIRYEFTVDDAATWERPWTAEMAMKKSVGPIFEHACHEGNYGLYNTLVGARLEERLAAEAAAGPTLATQYLGMEGRAMRVDSRFLAAATVGGLPAAVGGRLLAVCGLLLAVCGLLVAASVGVGAHHAFSAEFDVNKPLEVKGTLVKWEMINPTRGFISTSTSRMVQR